jgi:hypothetical protein
MAQLRDEMTAALGSLADSVRAGSAPPPLPNLRATQLALGKSDALVNAETDLLVDSVNTVAGLLAQAAAR